MRRHDEVKINTHTDCCKVWELLTADKLKAIQFAGDGGSIASKNIGLESNTNVEFEHVHVKTTNGNEDTIINKGLTMALDCNKKEKEERIKCIRENRGNNGLISRNTPLKRGKEMLEK